MLKLLAAAAVFGCCAFFGALTRESCILRIRTAEGMASDLAAMEALLRFERTDVASVARSLAVTGRLAGFWAELASSLGRGASFEEAWRAGIRPLSLAEDEKAVLAEFAARFGKSDIETELALLSLARERLAAAYSANMPGVRNRIRLSGTLSLLLGAALALMVL